MNQLDTSHKRRSEFLTKNFSSLASKNTDTNTNNMDNSHHLDIPKINNEIKYLLNHKKDKKVENNNLNNYEIKISPENENRKVEETLSDEEETEQNLYKQAKTEKATKDNLARFEHLKNKLSNNNKNNLKNLDTKLSNKNGENNIKSPTKIVINRAQTKTKQFQINNQENIDNFNINVIKTPIDNNVNFNKKLSKTNEEFDENKKSDSDNSNSSTEMIKDKKFTFLSRAVDIKNSNLNFDDQLENDINKGKFACPDIVVNGPDEEDMPIVESNDPKATKGTSGAYKTFNKNFMRQLSRISEISNYFSRDNDSNPNNSFDSGSIIKTKKKHTTKDTHFALKESTEEQELKWNLQIINLKDEKSKESIEQIDEKEDENFVNDSNRVDIQIVSDASSVSNNLKKNLIKRKQTMDIIYNGSSADSDVSQRPLISRHHNSAKVLPKFIEVPITPNLNRNERRTSDSRIVYTKTAERNINFSILGRDAKMELLKEKQKESKVVYYNKTNKILDKIEYQIKKEKNRINDKFTRYIHERCEKNLMKNYKKKKYDKVIKSFHTGVGELYLLEYINGNKEKEIIPNSGSSSELLSLTVQTEYIDYILNTYFKFSSLKLILKSLEKNIESDPNNKITLIKNFQYDDNEKVEINRDPTLVRMKTLAKNNEFLSRSIISKEAKDFFNNPNIPKNDKNYSISYFRLGVNNLVFYNKFLHLDLPEKENDTNLVNQYLIFDNKKEIIDINDSNNQFKNNIKRRKTQCSLVRKNSVRFNNMIVSFNNKKENDQVEFENKNSNNENSKYFIYLRQFRF